MPGDCKKFKPITSGGKKGEQQKLFNKLNEKYRKDKGKVDVERLISDRGLTKKNKKITSKDKKPIIQEERVKNSSGNNRTGGIHGINRDADYMSENGYKIFVDDSGNYLTVDEFGSVRGV